MKPKDFLALALDTVNPKVGKLLANGQETLVSRDMADYAVLFNDSDAMVAYEQFKAAAGDMPCMHAHSTPTYDCRTLFQLVCTLRPEKVLEIGTYIGSSTVHIAAALKHNGSGAITTVDIADVNAKDAPWNTEHHLPQSPRALAEKLGVDKQINFVINNSESFFAGNTQKFDFIFIDGSHSLRRAYFDMRNALGCLAPKGTIVMHDFYTADRNNRITGPLNAALRLQQKAPWLLTVPFGKLPWQRDDEPQTSLAALAKAA